MNESILTSIKKLLGISEETIDFDQDIILHINTVFMILFQLGVGPKTGFSISDDSSTWADFLGKDTSLEAVKTYIYLRVRLLFDPPSNSFLQESFKRNADELEWRLNVAVDPSRIEGD